MYVPTPGYTMCNISGNPWHGNQGVSVRCMKGGSTSGGGGVKDEGGEEQR